MCAAATDRRGDRCAYKSGERSVTRRENAFGRAESHQQAPKGFIPQPRYQAEAQPWLEIAIERHPIRDAGSSGARAGESAACGVRDF
jgi:hypothetical protein